MTDKEQLKKDTNELWKMIRNYQRTHSGVCDGPITKALKNAEEHMDLVLTIVSSDEENAQRNKIKCYC